jgi:hypothetical protein
MLVIKDVIRQDDGFTFLCVDSINPAFDLSLPYVLDGVVPAGYNGTYRPAGTFDCVLVIEVPSDPGPYVSGGTLEPA